MLKHCGDVFAELLLRQAQTIFLLIILMLIGVAVPIEGRFIWSTCPPVNRAGNVIFGPICE